MSEENGYEKIEGGDVFAFEKEGDAIEGTLVRIREGRYENSVYDIETANGMVVVFGGTVLDGRLSKSHVGKGIKIVFKGQKKSEQSGRTYNDFDIFVKKEQQNGE